MLAHFIQEIKNENKLSLEEAVRLGGAQGVTGQERWALRRLGLQIREQLALRLEEKGFRVARDHGLGTYRLDLAVGHPEEEVWRVGVDCSSFLTEVDPLARDVYSRQFWLRLGWKSAIPWRAP